MHNKKKRILLLVEGEASEVKLFNKILECFPEINVKKENIIVYKTNLFALNQSLIKEFGDKWYQEEIDFQNFLKNIPHIRKQIINLKDNQGITEDFTELKFTDTFLVFDYERQEPLFNAKLIENMLSFWSESTENGLLYLNYPMIEAYKHINVNEDELPDKDFLKRICDCTILFCNETKRNNKYKQIVGKESKHTDIRKFSRSFFKKCVIHNLCKASAITKSTTDISESIAKQYWENRDYKEILDVENRCSQSKQSGFVYVLATCLFFIPEYNSKLIFDNNDRIE